MKQEVRGLFSEQLHISANYIGQGASDRPKPITKHTPQMHTTSPLMKMDLRALIPYPRPYPPTACLRSMLVASSGQPSQFQYYHASLFLRGLTGVR